MTDTTIEVTALVDAMDQLLDDMGLNGQCVCLLAKAKARIAFEPFMDREMAQHFMPLEEAVRIAKECEDAR